ncbi:hypothetical protein QYH69_29495 [Paraburkholderia sp. SARCC-3016]|uniref:hypothetical protein n=1 Tax=Paraburkholderia sp. SARCC-3016 TaxID=3058611 RepID=UPI002809497C|nr:hypothetical protein [Paraburkholderia sp. SARCC-3016]MDQ7981371.1 hypothetical protein [Paraburkholderia sp. SARCC-3016]
MSERIPVTDVDIVREFRLRRIRGSATDAITNAALRICLANCAELRKKQKQPDQPTPDGKRLAAGDTE